MKFYIKMSSKIGENKFWFKIAQPYSWISIYYLICNFHIYFYIIPISDTVLIPRKTIVPGELAISGHIKLRKSLYKSDDEQLILLEEQLRKVQPK